MTVDRRRIIEMAMRRAKPGSGSDLLAMREPGPGYIGGAIAPDLGGVAHAIVGGLATALYMPERMTLDTDILVSAEDLEAAEAAMERAGCQKTGILTIGGGTWRMPGGRMVYLIALHSDWVSGAIATAVPGPGGHPYVRLPYLVLMKLESGRVQDLADISRMLGGAGEAAIAEVRDLVSRLRPEDREDLESLAQLGKLEQGGPESGTAKG